MFDATKKVLDIYADDVIERAKKNLNTKGFAQKNRKINATKSLSKSLGYVVASNNKGLVIEFTSKKKYASIVEEGRKKGYMPYKPLMNWIKAKKIRLRKVSVNKNGQKTNKFVQMNHKNLKSAAIAMAKAMATYNRKPTNFMGDAMIWEFKKLPEQLGKAILKDTTEIIRDEFKKSKYFTVTKE